ncbi:putative copper resistance protein D [Kineococcus radiotolerans]|uniref:Copper resistance D domain protein n=2 Tax=Kineococcus radiotolerans TaxID=131568 RepID=A6WFZ9_KINRD|nr:bifunctional copper resistance protein CopD/cytochrome c oxidase assembly protein [Kineococcus radiotolerans]ABS05738.1 copper resistance D domain protein [Kineococcus radiotolerans SRS30216 = ATCC BAA-149]MBB2902621.1 putative copper resistance protein D [Kineococcus radiotolerans]
MAAPTRTARSATPVTGVLLTSAAVLLAALAVLLTALALAGGLTPSAFGDPGALVRYGLPVARTVHDLAAALAVGGFAIATFLLPQPSDAFTRAVRVGGVAAGVWAVAALVVLLLTAVDVIGAAPGGAGFGAQFAQFAQSIDLGRALLVTTVLAAVAATVGAAATGPTGAAWGTAVSLIALLPLSLSGHASGSASHETAVSSLAMHLIGVTVWVGGLAAVLLVAPLTGRSAGPAKGRRAVDLPTLAARYSTVALWCFAAVALSGVLNASVRLGGWSGLASPYGALVIAKVVALVALGALGVWHRRRTIPLLADRPRAFLRIAAGELVLMGAATGLGVALSRSPTPVPDDDPASSPAEDLLGEPLPGPLTVGRWFTETSPDLLWLTIGGLVLVGYLLGVRRLRARGDAWPVGRTVWWVLGCLALLFVTSGGPAAYGRTAFSTHMLQHMLLTMVVPPMLVLGAPVTLALRVLPARRDHSRGAREWLLEVVHSRYFALVGHPLVAAALFAGSLIVFYYSPLFELALRTHVGHELMMVHFLGTGYLFASVLIGVDPGAHRPAYPLRLILLLATMAFHAFFGVALMQGTALLAADWFSRIAPGTDLLADQQRGGDIAWGIGEVPTIVLVLGVAIGWSRSDTRENRRRDRKAARDGDAELNDYNAMLQRLADQGEPRR